MTYSVSQLFYYPVKSLGAIQTEQFEVDLKGPRYDRRMMVVDEQGLFVTQRESPIMTLIGVTDTHDDVVLTFENNSIAFPYPKFSEQTSFTLVTVWDDAVSAQRVSNEVDVWLSEVLSKRVHLVCMPENAFRQVDTDYANVGDQTSFSDGFPFLMLSQASMDFLSEKVGYSLSVERFRPNIVIEGCEPFEEDTWRHIQIGGVKFDVVKPCSRCVIPSINLQTSLKDRDVMQALVQYRKIGKHVYVGQNLIHRDVGEVAVGNSVLVLD